jgi:hypothetical protein
VGGGVVGPTSFCFLLIFFRLACHVADGESGGH